jgi:hypothetical protein
MFIFFYLFGQISIKCHVLQSLGLLIDVALSIYPFTSLEIPMPFHSTPCEMLTAFLLVCVQFKLCKVRSVQFGQKGIPYLNTYDGRTIRYPDPLIKANDTIKIDLETNKIMDFIKLYLPFHRLHQVIYLVRLNVSTNS